MVKGKKFISDLKLYSDYLKWDDPKERFETWSEAVDKVLNTHRLRYGSRVNDLLEEVKPSYLDKEILASQRNLQFREELIINNNAKLYNCCVTYAYSPDVLSKGFWVLLSGTGLGVSLKKKFTSQLPPIQKRRLGTKTYVVPDSIEGWADAMQVLASSYMSHTSLLSKYFGYEIKFDYSLIRPRGALITGGFKAPGHEGLQQCFERVERMYNDWIDENGGKKAEMKNIILYDTFMHLSDAVLSGGVRRSAMDVIVDEDDEEMIYAKTGDWRQSTPWRERSNNSVGLKRNDFTKKQFEDLVALNEGISDIGFTLMSHEDEMFNPCFEIGFNFYEKIKNKTKAVFQFCNLNEISASSCVDIKGRFSKEKFYQLCERAAILGTLQAGYTNFPYLGKETERIVAGESLLGISITGWMTRPELFDPEILTEGARVVKETNERVATQIGINPAARTTCVKPSGNASVILQTSSGIHPEHSKRYFRVMQLNKDAETAQWLKENRPEMLEDSVYSASNTDYVVFTPCENPDGTLYKDEMKGIKHLELIKLVQKYWVREGAIPSRAYNPLTEHNVSNTVIIDDKPSIVDYLYTNQDDFTAVAFMSDFGDKDWNQAPFTSVLNTQELVDRYGDGVIFMAGLIVDGLHHFHGNLWEASSHILDKDLPISGTREQVLLRKDWLRRAKQFSKKYLKGDIQETVYCMKDVHLWHKWNKITKGFRPVDFTEILSKPSYVDINTIGAVACSGPEGCEVTII